MSGRIVWDIIEDRFNPAEEGSEKRAKKLAVPDRGKALLVPFITTAIEALVDVAQNQRAYAPARVAAANSILDRVYGRPEAIEPLPPAPAEGTGVLLISDPEERVEWLNRAQTEQKALMKT